MFESLLYEFMNKIKKSFFHFIEKEEWYVVSVNSFQYVFGVKSKKTKEIICLYSFLYDPVHQIVELNSKYHHLSTKPYFPTVYEAMVKFLQEQSWDCFVRTSTISTIYYYNKNLPIHYTGNRTKNIYSWLEKALDLWEGSKIIFQQKQNKVSIQNNDIGTSFEMKWNVQGVFINEQCINSEKEWITFFNEIQTISVQALQFLEKCETIMKNFDPFYQKGFRKKSILLFQQQKDCSIQLLSKTTFVFSLDKFLYEITNLTQEEYVLKEVERYVKKERLKAVVEGRNKTM